MGKPCSAAHRAKRRRLSEPDRYRLLATATFGQWVTDLGRMHRAGYWEDDPSEIKDYGKEWRSAVSNGNRRHLQIDATEEGNYWRSSGPELMLELLQDAMGVELDREDVVRLAKRQTGGGRFLEWAEKDMN